MTEVKILKLSSGEEIICNVIDNENQSFINVTRPMNLNATMQRSVDGLTEALSLQRWIHFAEESTFKIEKEKVIVKTDASVGLAKFYSYCLHKIMLEEDEYGESPTLEELEEIENEFSDFEVYSTTIH